MKEHKGRLPQDQQELEKQCGYTGLKNQVTHLIKNAQEQGVIEPEHAETVVTDALHRMEDQRLSAIINCNNLMLSNI